MKAVSCPMCMGTLTCPVTIAGFATAPFFDFSSFGNALSSGFGNLLVGVFESAAKVAVQAGVTTLLSPDVPAQQAVTTRYGYTPAEMLAVAQAAQLQGQAQATQTSGFSTTSTPLANSGTGSTATTPAWVLPAAIGGGVLLLMLVFAATRK